MNTKAGPSTPFSRDVTLFPERTARLLRLEVLLQVVGLVAAVVRHGLTPRAGNEHLELGVVVLLAMGGLTVSMAMRHHWSLATPTFFRVQRGLICLSLLWCAGLIGILIVGPQIPSWSNQTLTRGPALVRWSELMVVLRGVLCAVRVTRRVAAAGASPPLLLVGSFLALVVVGSLLLMLPRAREVNAQGEPQTAPWSVAVFTATSAGCVTGLTVVPTGEYWSRTGQCIILCLFQLGGLGIMTCGAFFAVAAGRQMEIRETATLRDLLESDALGSARQLLVAVLLFTLGAEAVGALLLSGLWSELPVGERVFYSFFHSVSAFCNAGFALDSDGFQGQATRWQVWGGALRTDRGRWARVCCVV
jgi:trk system potassium uptake protein TrkH